jgi:hypothetical protein
VKALSDCVSCLDEYPAIHISSQGFVCQSCVYLTSTFHET